VVDILIGDGRVLYADLLSSSLGQHGFEPVGTVEVPDDLLEEIERRRPAVCLVDHRTIAGPDHDRFLRALKAAASGRTKIVLLSRQPLAPASSGTAEALGVDGVVDKRASLQSLLEGLEEVLAGETVTITPTAHGHPKAEDASWFRYLAAGLTPRERECLALLVEGRTTEEIQDTLSVSVMTVRSHVRSLLRKLGAHSRLEAASLAVRYDLLDDDVLASRAG
jgi:two-component system, NarL family, nitrate/nitrite response regulator NarL